MNRPDVLPALIQPAELLPQLGRDDLRIVDLSPADHAAAARIPGAISLPYGRIVHHRPPVMGLLPDLAERCALYQELGLGPDTGVVALDSEGGAAAGRLLWTLHTLGHERASLLDGGLPAWRAEGFPLEPGAGPRPQRSTAACRNEDSVIADAPWILDRLEQEDFRLLDARSRGEYDGSTRRAAHGGHIPHARHYEWTRAIDPGSMKMRPAAAILAELAALDVTPEHEVAVYCHSHHRSGFSYWMLRTLGFPRVRGYPGSWSDWGNRDDVPIETGA